MQEILLRKGGLWCWLEAPNEYGPVNPEYGIYYKVRLHDFLSKKAIDEVRETWCEHTSFTYYRTLKKRVFECDGMYVVVWFGADGSFHEDEKATLTEAKDWAIYVK